MQRAPPPASLPPRRRPLLPRSRLQTSSRESRWRARRRRRSPRSRARGERDRSRSRRAGSSPTPPHARTGPRRSSPSCPSAGNDATTGSCSCRRSWPTSPSPSGSSKGSLDRRQGQEPGRSRPTLPVDEGAGDTELYGPPAAAPDDPGLREVPATRHAHSAGNRAWTAGSGPLAARAAGFGRQDARAAFRGISSVAVGARSQRWHDSDFNPLG